MKYQFIAFLAILYVSSESHAYEGPNPLQNIMINVDVSSNSMGLVNYQYSISNPKINNGSIYSVNIFLSQDPQQDSNPPDVGFKHCSAFFKTTSANAQKARPMTAVGSGAPAHWSCSYGTLAGFDEGSYGWGARDNPHLISPGTSQTGFSLVSYGLPAIRNVLIKPIIELENLPPEYNENLEKTVALENKVRWLGKTVGPKAPPKVFVAADFLNYLISLKDQSVALGWITGAALERELGDVFTRAQKKLDPCDQSELKEILGKLIEGGGICEHGRKGLSPEAHALLSFNAKYFISQLPKLSKVDREKCEKSREHRGHNDH